MADDGVRVWIDDRLVIDRDGSIELTGTANLVASRLYPIRIEYYNGSSPAMMSMSWSSPSRSKQVVRPSRLFVEDVSP